MTDLVAHIDHARLSWRKSSYSSAEGADCVEVAGVGGAVAVRDSKNPAGPALIFTSTELGRFLDAVKANRL